MVKKNKIIQKKVPISKCTVVGNNWGLICNSIHLLDFFRGGQERSLLIVTQKT